MRSLPDNAGPSSEAQNGRPKKTSSLIGCKERRGGRILLRREMVQGSQSRPQKVGHEKELGVAKGEADRKKGKVVACNRAFPVPEVKEERKLQRSQNLTPKGP